MQRLEAIAPDLSRSLDCLSPRQTRQICAAVCSAAVRHVRLDEPIVNEALIALTNCNPLAPSLRDAAVALTERLDTTYFDLQDAADEGRATQTQVLDAFSRARAANAVAFALSGFDPSTAKEVIYEAAAVTDNLTELENLIDATLQSANNAS
jgi:hypothetical protein